MGGGGREVERNFKETHHIDVPVEVKNIPDVRDYKASADRAKQVLGFAPKGSVASVLRGLDEHFGPSFGNYNDDIFYNIRVFKKLLA